MPSAEVLLPILLPPLLAPVLLALSSLANTLGLFIGPPGSGHERGGGPLGLEEFDVGRAVGPVGEECDDRRPVPLHRVQLLVHRAVVEAVVGHGEIAFDQLVVAVGQHGRARVEATYDADPCRRPVHHGDLEVGSLLAQQMIKRQTSPLHG